MLVLFLLGLGGCFRHGNTGVGAGYSRFGDREFGGRYAGFVKSPIEHIIAETPDPIIVRRIGGIIRSEGGEWPAWVEVIFEIRGPGTVTKIRGVLADQQGRFKMGSLPSGSYSFKATANGWQSVVGTIIVSKDANPGEVDLLMPLGR